MPPSRPFVDTETGGLDLERILEEATPIATLIALFAAVAFVPMAGAFVTSVAGLEFAAWLLTVAAQFVLAVGTAIVLLYVIVRASQLSDE